MQLKKVDIKEFKEIIYPEYKEIFPKSERKSYKTIEKSFNNGITEIFEIIVDNKFVGFFITNFLKNNPYIQMDYFAILPQYQNKGYGTNAIKQLQEIYKNYDGIFIEIEKVGNGKNEKENNIRERRAKFYEKLGFLKLGFDLELYKVIFNAYMLPCKTTIFEDKEVINKIFEIYYSFFGEKVIRKNCKVIK